MRTLFPGWLPQPSPAANRRRAKRKHRPDRRSLSLEPLEDRALMAVVSWWTANNTTADSVGTNHAGLARGAASRIGDGSVISTSPGSGAPRTSGCAICRPTQ
jgi:hypothetical protein